MEGTISQLGLKNYLINNKKRKNHFLNTIIKILVILLKLH